MAVEWSDRFWSFFHSPLTTTLVFISANVIVVDLMLVRLWFFDSDNM